MKKETVNPELIKKLFPVVKCEIVSLPETEKDEFELIGKPGHLIGTDPSATSLIFVNLADGEHYELLPGTEILIIEGEAEETKTPANAHSAEHEQIIKKSGDKPEAFKGLEDAYQKEKTAQKKADPTGSGEKYPYNQKQGDKLNCLVLNNGFRPGDVVLFEKITDDHNIQIRDGANNLFTAAPAWYEAIKK
jgi:hypothetical protein